jgi:hypothetical protein
VLNDAAQDFHPLILLLRAQDPILSDARRVIS